jgi:hypothetical protein
MVCRCQHCPCIFSPTLQQRIRGVDRSRFGEQWCAVGVLYCSPWKHLPDVVWDNAFIYWLSSIQSLVSFHPYHLWGRVDIWFPGRTSIAAGSTRESLPCPIFSLLSLFWNMKFWEEQIAYFPWSDKGHIKNDASNNSSIVACVFVTAVTFPPSRCLETIGGYADTHTHWQQYDLIRLLCFFSK